MPSDKDQSEYNMAVSYLNRLNALFYTADEAALDLDVYLWFHTLIALSRELSTWMDEQELQKRSNYIEKITPLVSLQNKSYLSMGTPEITNELYTLLDTFEIFIRRILRNSGLQDKLKDDANFALR